MEATQSPLAGLWKPTHLSALYYGRDIVKDHLMNSLPKKESKAFIITGNSLATKTPLIKELEGLLRERHAGTFSKIGEHAPIKQLDEATELVKKDSSIDTIISVGGGSPCDSAKAIVWRVHEKSDKWMFHITIPTTLSAAECTMGAGFTGEDGTKTGVAGPEIAVNMIFYDSKYALETPPSLWLSTGFRAMDHAMELMYHPTASELCRLNCMQAASNLYKYLPLYKKDPKNEDTITQLQLAAFQSLGYYGLNMKGGLGLSHTLGYALGSPYGIPHGYTSCMTLGHVIKLKASMDKEAAHSIARMTPYLGLTSTGDDVKDSEAIGDRILQLVKDLGLKTTLTERGVGKDQVDLIVRRATGARGGQEVTEGPLYNAVKQLVENLY